MKLNLSGERVQGIIQTFARVTLKNFARLLSTSSKMINKKKRMSYFFFPKSNCDWKIKKKFLILFEKLFRKSLVRTRSMKSLIRPQFLSNLFWLKLLAPNCWLVWPEVKWLLLYFCRQKIRPLSKCFRTASDQTFHHLFRYTFLRFIGLHDLSCYHPFLSYPLYSNFRPWSSETYSNRF